MAAVVEQRAPRQERRGPLAAWLSLVGSLALINFGARLEGGRPEEDTLYRWETAIGGIVLYAIIFGILLLIARRGPAVELFALRRPISWARALGLAVLVLVGVFVVSLALNPLLHPGREQGLTTTEWDPDRSAAYFANALVIAVVAPIVEELSYRGLGFALLRRWGLWLAVVGTALAFALGHGLVYAFPVLLAFGIGLALLRARTDSILPCIVLHAFFNGAALALALAA